MSYNIKHPTPNEWIKFFDKLFLILTGLFFVSSVGFFIAYNWEAMGKFFKFILIEVGIISLVIVSLYVSSKTISDIMILFASFLVGIFMALFGQVYQTQADSWELFFYWALVISPWVWTNRFVGTWLLWIILFEISMWLYFENYIHTSTQFLWIVFGFNTAFLAIWQYISTKLNIKYAFILYKMLFFFSTMSIISLMFTKNLILPILVWGLWIGAIYYFYRYKTINIYALSMMSLSVIVVSDILVVRLLDKIHIQDMMMPLLMIGFITIGLGASLANWLKSVSKELDNDAR